ncbi:MAG: hypothetical protein P8J32_00165 [bacterium]|nr:hypothetical protein [bacterium]
MNEMKLRLDELLMEMYIPDERKNLNFTSNIRWLLRNLGIYNSDSEGYDEALDLLRTLTKKMRC